MAVDSSLLSGADAAQDDSAVVITPAPTPVRRALKVIAYVAIFLAALILFVVLKLPDALISNSVLNSLNNNTPYRWQADKISAHFFLFPHLNTEKLTMEGKGFSTLPPITFDTLTLYPSLLSFLPLTGSMNPKVSFDGTAYGANLKGSSRSRRDMALTLNADNVNLAKLTPLSQAGIDLQGIFTKVAADLELPDNDLSKADGTVEFSGKNFVMDPAALQIPMALPVMDLGTVEVRGKATNGKLKIDHFQVGAPGKDLEIRITGEITLQKNPMFSPANLRVVLKPSAKVLSAVPSIEGLLGTLATKQADGYYAMRFTGTLGNLGLPRPDK
ncbi:MAG: type II secretion system protein GspN [Proteobacteria bacterium]|nr:MAG: type II secretion system protein GspN [Pseudomonadota bacterium]